MNKLISAIVVSLAIPAVAQAQAPAPKSAEMECCAQMKAGMDCAKHTEMHQQMHGKMDAHGGHDMKSMKPAAEQPEAKEPEHQH